jgi:23S rRNA (guanosine2251-2'-O)-methyltransferase
MPLLLRNPHSVLAVLETRPKDVLEIILPTKGSPHGTGGLGDAWDRVAQKAREFKIPVNVRTQKPMRPARGGSIDEGAESTRASIAQASVKDRTGISAEELFKNAQSRKTGKGLWLALDNLQDPHNVGAIFRAAAFFGVEGILLTQDRSASLTATVYDVASGGMEYVPFTVQTNLQRAFEIAKDSGLWILGTSEHAHDSLTSIQKDRPWLLVLGNEERGMRRLTEESCDVLCTIPGSGKVTSLNVSVAAGILISHLV